MGDLRVCRVLVLILRSVNPRIAATHFVSQQNGGNSSQQRINTMTTQKLMCHCANMSHPATDRPVLLIDADAPLRDLHACASERLNAVLKYLDLMDHAEHDIYTVTTIARIMVQDVSDIFRVVEQRGFDVPG